MPAPTGMNEETIEVSVIILANDLIESRVRKRKELEFYNKQLAEWQERLEWIGQQINLTTRIVKMIEAEQVLDLKSSLKAS